jgi:hypothetical protein
MPLTFAIALGQVLKSQRRWLIDFHDIARSVHPLSCMCRAATQVSQELQWF